MLFNSIPFLIFLPCIFFLYWFIFKKNKKAQNILLLLGSYFFYAWWDYRFLVLILFSTVVDYLVGIALHRTEELPKRRLLLFISLFANLGLLFFFKYFNFFIESWIDAWSYYGVTMDINTLNIILPVGISFYTFQTLSYTIDVYKKRMIPAHSFINFSTYVSFFPQLVAGPIERASQLLPQFKTPRTFSYDHAKSGIHLIIWGLFQKVVIADNCATYVNAIFSNQEKLNSLSLTLGAVYFAFQIYGDFAGYSNIAIGTARLFGFDLMRNFNYPYFSRNIAEFWRRWHISLSTWFRDYLYIPLGGSRGPKMQQVRNVFIIFLVSGFWHGANWTFIIWGGLHAVFFLPLLLRGSKRKNVSYDELGLLPSIRQLSGIIFTFLLNCFAWIFFRAANLKEAVNYINRMFLDGEFKIEYLNIERYNVEMLVVLFLFIGIEWFHREHEHPIVGKMAFLKLIMILLLLIALGVFSNHQDFIYFQF